MLKKLLSFSVLGLLAAGCATTFTNLTPQQQERSSDNIYPVEVALSSEQETLRWNSIRAQIQLGNTLIQMHPTPFMTNRWEGRLPVASGQNQVRYHFKFDYEYNAMGGPKTGTFVSKDYALRIRDR